ncbi:MAG: ABC transporter permease subunit [Akkermansiaceae bacterium]|nr:ABC transporter permease subunit [Akkermansiaceae bacterium]
MRKKNHPRGDWWSAFLLRALVGVVFVLLALLIGFILWFSLPVFLARDTQVFSSVWQPGQGRFGIVPMIVGSALLAVSASLAAFPMAVGICGFCLIHPRAMATRVVRYLVKLMAGIPTVVYGLAALFLLIPLLRDVFGQGSGFSLLAAVMMVVLLILPVMVMILDSQLTPFHENIALSATALGMRPRETVLYVVIPHSVRALTTAAILGFSRAIGDTMLPLMLAGNATQMPDSAFDSIRTLTAHIGLVIATEKGSAAYNSLFAAGLVLLAISLFVTLLTRSVGGRQIRAMEGAGL